MPKGPRGEKRPADVVGNAVKVMRIAIQRLRNRAKARAVTRGKAGGPKGGRARAMRLTPKQRAEIARVAARTRWKKSP